jgi:hypothetical protein
MKKLFVLVGCISLIAFSCHKNHLSDPITHQKPGLTNPGRKKVSLKVIDIYSKLYAIKRRIDFINEKTNSVLGKMFITLSCNDPSDNLYRKIENEPEKFSGLITLESSHLIGFTKRILNGQLVKVENVENKVVDGNSKTGVATDPEPDPAYAPSCDSANSTDAICPWQSIQSCANAIVENMYWLDFALCAIKGHCLTKAIGTCINKCK